MTTTANTKTSVIEYDYFTWLTSQIELPRHNRNTYGGLFEKMHEVEFVWTISGDDNRVQDARDLRVEFLHGKRYRFRQGISVLEVLIALSRRTAFTAGGTPESWAWKLIENLTLNKMSDPLSGQKMRHVEEILDALVWRTYQRNGYGGFFPLHETVNDQTQAEIWYQMNEYVMEMERR